MTATISNQGKYGYGKFPFGRCETRGCNGSACYRIEVGGKPRLLCLDHKPANVLFSPFLGAQSDFWSRTERWVLGGGGAGGSKTFIASRLWIKQYTISHAAWKAGKIQRSLGHAIFFRRTVPELLQVIDEFLSYVKDIDPGVHWNMKDKIATFPCGYKVQFGGMEHDDDWRKYYGAAYTLVVMDEGTQFTRRQVEEIDSRVRTVDPILAPMIQLVLTTNPIGYGLPTKAWLKRRFVKIAEPGTPVKVRVVLADGRTIEEWQVYCPFNLYDNPALMRDGKYEASLMTRSNIMRRALLDNDWDVEDGAWVDPDWEPSIHICAPFAIPNGWFKFKSGDYGFSSRSSINWFAVDPDHNKILYRHLSCRGMTAEDLGLLIRQIESQPLYARDKNGDLIMVTGPDWDEINDQSLVRGPMDSALWARQGETGPSRGEILQRLGVGFYKSDKNPYSAAESVRSHLRRRTTRESGEIVPGLRVFSTARARLQLPDGEFEDTGPLETIPTCPVDPGHQDIWHNTSDLNHDLDSIGYGLLSRPLPGEEYAVLSRRESMMWDSISLRFKGQQKPRLASWANDRGVTVVS